jgi:hypothetical protein
MKAPNEFAWAAFLDALAVAYKYESLEARLSRAIRYQPDFWLPDSLAWLEIKPQYHTPTDGEARVARLLVEATARPCYLVAGWPDARLRMWGYFRGRDGTASANLALVWLTTLLNRPIGEVLRASAGVMARQYEFVRMWREATEGNRKNE